METHNKYMLRAIELAKMGAGQVSPNPMVGAVIVHGGKIIGEGYHERYGQAHAEVNAINQVFTDHSNAALLLRQSAIYVTLEPCAHFGKTPPCADLIIQHGIPNVFIGCTDPFGEVNGHGIKKLKAAGINVAMGILQAQCLDLNKRFFTRIQKQRPYIILKWAQTADGFIAPTDGKRFWITGPLSQRLVHQWRSEEDAILVGKNTALADNPQLNVRLWQGRNPKRVVIDRKLELPQYLHLLDGTIQTFVFNEVKTDVSGNTKYIALEDFDRFVPQYILYQLYLQDVQSLIIEGGAKTLQSFIDAELWDEARVFTSKKWLKQGINAPIIAGETIDSTTIGDDLLTLIEPYAF